MSDCLSICRPSPFVCPSVCQSVVCQFVCLSNRMSVSRSVCHTILILVIIITIVIIIIIIVVVVVVVIIITTTTTKTDTNNNIIIITYMRPILHSPSVFLSICLSKSACQSAYMSICPFFFLFVCLSVGPAYSAETGLGIMRQPLLGYLAGLWLGGYS